MRSSDANCRPKRIQIHPCSRWSSLHLITSSLSPASGTSCVNFASSRRPPVRSSQWSASMRRLHWRSRISESGSDTIHDLVHTTCTVNTATWPSEALSPNATPTWLLAIVLVPIQFRWESLASSLVASSADCVYHSSLQIIKIEKVVAAKTRRNHVKQFHDSTIKFPLVQRYHHKRFRQMFSVNRPTTHYN